jgi:hypothetical protein
MNLVQIQERLKDLPMQAVMSYANGQNPQVPPYLALGELNRRKQMEQKAAQPPTGTVKDNIEQQVGLMQLQKLRQGQMSQQMGQQGMQAPTIPEGTPEPAAQPEEEMPSGVVADLPIREMNFGSGGIIAFADTGLVSEAEAAAKAAKQKLGTYSLSQRLKDPEGYAAAQSEAAITEDRLNKAYKDAAGEDTSPVGALRQPIIPPAAIRTPVSEAQATALAGPQAAVPPKVQPPAPPAPPPSGIVNTLPPKPAQPPAPPAPPAAPVMSDAQKFQQGILSGTNLPAMPSEYAPPKQAPIGEDYMAYMADRVAKRKGDEEKFKQRESGRSQRDFFNSLISAGEATRGQKGIGSLFGGFGKAYSQSATEAEDRQAAFEQKQQELADNDAKTKFEIANLRRAEERGDSKGVYDSKMKLYELKQDQLKIQGQVASDIVKRDAEKELAAIKFEYDKKLKGIPQAQRATLEEQYVQAAVKAGKSLPDAIREVKTLGVEAKGQLTYGQASDDIDKWLASTAGMSYIAEARKAAKEQNKPLPDQFTIRNQLIKKAMEESGSSKAPTVDTSKWGDPKVK